ncbi:MAG: ThiF family adenylyltransferase [Kiritimatiellae bacterium]|jgi:hypothetical protein|nr:ThiF family adenylyltransferase [Kiritimatiellia bacterium]
MSQRLINLNPDLKQLRDEGYHVRTVSGHLVVEHVPYVNSKREVAYGKLVSKLELAGDKTIKPRQHVVMFAGEHPCNADGSLLKQIKHNSNQKQLAEGLVVEHSFSSKPKDGKGYIDYHHKMSTYAEIIASQARRIDPNATATPHLPIEDVDEDSVFLYEDTASSRAGIGAVTDKLKVSKVGIVGLGGTGSYILDLIAKTPVQEIHLFDGDVFSSHNAFRAPGAASIEELRKMPLKVEYYAQKYGIFRTGIVSHADYLKSDNLTLLDEMQYVFLSMDGSEEKAEIIRYLQERSIPFIDSGLGIDSKDGALGGVIRVTTSSAQKNDHVGAKISYGGGRDNPYDTNIQVADLNAFAACQAVMRWKKLLGFYRDLEREHHSLFTIDGNHLINEESP